MPPRLPPTESAELIALRQLDDEDAAALEQIARELGPPHGAGSLSDREKVRLWGLLDPRVDPDILPQRLMLEGLPQEEAQELAVLQEYPDLLELYVTPTQDAELADMLTRVAERPYVLSILEGIDDPGERVKEAERIESLWLKEIERRQAELAPMMMPPPSMPTPPMAGQQPAPSMPLPEEGGPLW